MNTVLLRQVADRIDPATRAEGTAGYCRYTFGRGIGKNLRRTNIEKESDTECCVVGHTIIQHFGVEKYLNYVNDYDSIYDAIRCAEQVLKLTSAMSWELFTLWTMETALPEDAASAAIILRDHADKYDAEQNERV